MTTLTGKVALVTGGTSGIGKATAIAFAQAGAKVVVAGRRQSEGEAVVDKIQANGGEAFFIRTDVSNEAQVETLIETAMTTYGRLDLAFNNAGVEGEFGISTAEQTAEHYQQVFDINVKGVLLSMKHEIAAMLASGGGAIVNTASVASTIGLPGVGIYVASKHAVLGLTRSAALEYAQQGIRINAISPGSVETEMLQRAAGDPAEASAGRTFLKNLHPIGRFATPEEIAATVVFLVSSDAAFVTGANLLADGGWTAQ
ncbi:SDR family oxidoreductase [Leptolyngbya sp. AN03gr2]|uniref:SDR family oxidoreductase n=1 Tax=unclassified Leptolyngbya TaxID=2650499 RepID=UPI003D322EED